MNLSNFKISLRIWHPEMDLEPICNTLGLRSNHFWKKGDQRKTPKGTILNGVYETSYCSCTLIHGNDAELQKILKDYNKIFFLHKELFWHIRSTGGNIEYFIGWFITRNTGEVFDFDLLKSLAELGIEVALDIYPEPVEESGRRGP